jgi:F-type H+-transporting ATPase subunit d
MSAAAAIDFSRLSKLGLARQTQQALAAFRKRAADAQIQAAALKDAKVDVDFAHYRAVLKNKSIVEEGEKLLKGFKPVTYDVEAQLKAISAFEGKAVSLGGLFLTS